MPAETIFTIGHSTHPIGEFVALLKAHGIRHLVDVRTIPRSRHNPQFEQEALRAALADAGTTYRWARDLGGLRHAHKDSRNKAWRNDSFRGYADYMQTPEFAAAVAGLVEEAQDGDLVIMCSEAVPWRCHRSLIGDALLVRGMAVRDIMGVEKAPPHKLTTFAVVDGVNVTYPEVAADGGEGAAPDEA